MTDKVSYVTDERHITTRESSIVPREGEPVVIDHSVGRVELVEWTITDNDVVSQIHLEIKDEMI